jgi:enediyne biosynthesis protein E3
VGVTPEWRGELARSCATRSTRKGGSSKQPGGRLPNCPADPRICLRNLRQKSSLDRAKVRRRIFGRSAFNLAQILGKRTVTVTESTIAADARSWVRYSPPLIRQLLRLSLDEASFKSRGFAASTPTKQATLEGIGRTFIGGYNAALTATKVEDIVQYIRDISSTERGFAVEGAAMGAAVSDALPFRRSLLPACIEAFEHDFTYLAHVGAGWSLARMPWRRTQIIALLDPIHCWLAYDGLGFHDTYFKHRRVFAGWRRESSGYRARAYDQGVGRALWFVTGGSIEAVILVISKLPEIRQNDLWSGLGLAMAYAGPISSDEIIRAFQSAGLNGIHFAQGIAFACEARLLARHVPPHTELAARTIWGDDAEMVSELVREARNRLPETDGDFPRYELWRQYVASAVPHVMGW